MNDLLGTTLQDLLASLKAKRIRVPSEIGAFVALEVCEAVARGPARVSAAEVRIGDDGTVSIFVPPNSASSEDAASSVVGLLASALVAAGTGVPSALIRLVEDGAPTGPGCLDRLQSELESALVPLNRAAARRVLSRMVREARRDAPRALSERPGPVARLDEALDDLLEPRSTEQKLDDALDAALTLPKPAKIPANLLGAAAAPAPSADLDPVDALLMDVGGAPAARSDDAATIADAVDPAMPTIADEGSSERADPTPPRGRPAPASASAPRAEPARARREAPARVEGSDLLPDEPPPAGGGALGLVLAFVIVAVLSAAVLAWMRPDLVDRALGRPPPPAEPVGPTPEELAARARADRARYGSIVVRSTPPEAQVLLYVGRGPAIVEDLSPGGVYELVAIADGMAPSRALVPADAAWETNEEGLLRYELAMQVPDEPMEASRLDLGESRMPDDVGTPRAEVGSLRVVTSPPGAKVYLLVGFTPDVHVENVSTEEVVELLVFLEGHDVERVVVAPSDWHDTEDGTRAAELDVTLHERARGR